MIRLEEKTSGRKRGWLRAVVTDLHGIRLIGPWRESASEALEDAKAAA